MSPLEAGGASEDALPGPSSTVREQLGSSSSSAEALSSIDRLSHPYLYFLAFAQRNIHTERGAHRLDSLSCDTAI